MELIKYIAVNLAVLAFIFAIMMPPALAEGRLGKCSVEVIAFMLSLVMTLSLLFPSQLTA